MFGKPYKNEHRFTFCIKQNFFWTIIKPMLYYLTKYLSQEFTSLSFLRLFSDYITFRAFTAAAGAFFFMLIFGNKAIILLYQHKIRNVIRDYQNISPHSKMGTPTMGGILIIASILSMVLLFGNLKNPFLICITLSMLWYGIIGAIDDLGKIKTKKLLN